MSSRIRFDIRQLGPKLIAVLGIAIAVNLAFWFLAVRPRVSEYGALVGDDEPKVLLGQRQKIVEVAEGYLNALHQAETDLKTLRTEILSTREARMVDVQRELAKLCKEFSIDLDGVRYENEILEAEELERFGMVVPLQGGYSNLRKFLQAVESSPRFLLVEQVELGQSQEGGGKLELSITLATYFDAPEEILPGRRGAGRPRRG
jgi:Tfp pilus assembly protein PilO